MKFYKPSTDFKASWITAENLPEPAPANLWLVFRKRFTLDEVPEKAIARIACDSRYWLFVNEKMVVYEGQLKRGPTPDDTYHDVVDISKYLKNGENLIVVQMWYFGKSGFSHKSSGVPGFLFDASTNGAGGLELLSDSSWKAAPFSYIPDSDEAATHENRIGAFELKTGDPQPNYRLSESNVRFDARYDFPGDFKHFDFEDTNWPNANELGKVPCAPWNQLYERPIPLWKDFGRKKYVNDADIPEVSNGEPIHCRLPHNAQIAPYLKVDAPEGCVIDMRTDNYKGGSEYNVRSEYVTKAGIQEFESPAWSNGHEMIYTIPAGVKIIELGYRETGYETGFAAEFECDDPFLNKLWEKAVRTLYITMRDSYYDCPDRERAQWWGDAVNELGEAFYTLDPESWKIARKGIYELARWQKPNGVLFSPCPGVYDTELPMQMLASVGTSGFGTYAFYSGDYGPIIDTYPQVKKYLELFKFADDGLIIHRTGSWDWGDWGDNIDLRVLTNAWYYLSLKQLKVTAEKSGNATDVPEIEAKMKKIAENFDKVFWTGTEYRDPNYEKKTDDRANAMAVISGLAGPDKYEAIREVLSVQKHASPYMEKYVLESLFMMGFPDEGIARMKERYKKMIEHEYTTLWEGWGIGAEGFGGGTINHAWSGGGLTVLAQYAVGLSPTKPAFEEFQVVPRIGPLKKIRYSMAAKYGDIKVELEKSDEIFKMVIEVPEGTVAIVPVSKEFTENRTAAVIWFSHENTDGKFTHGKSAGPFKLGPGKWTLMKR